MTLDNKWLLVIPAVLILLIAFYPIESEEAMCLKTCKKKLAKRAQAEAEKETIPLVFDTNDTKKFLEDVLEHPDKFKDVDPVFISLITSKTCKISSNCPTIKWLADSYDNSDRYLSGDFTNETGEWKREKPVVSNVFEIYKNGYVKLILFVEPDSYTMERTKQIFIEPTLYDFFDRKGGSMGIEQVKVDNFTKVNQRITYSDYSIDRCSRATMGWSNGGIDLLGEIIKHFYSNCKSIIAINNTNVIQSNLTEFNYYCGQECQYQKWLKNATESVKQGGNLIGKH